MDLAKLLQTLSGMNQDQIDNILSNGYGILNEINNIKQNENNELSNIIGTLGRILENGEKLLNTKKMA